MGSLESAQIQRGDPEWILRLLRGGSVESSGAGREALGSGLGSCCLKISPTPYPPGADLHNSVQYLLISFLPPAVPRLHLSLKRMVMVKGPFT